MNCETFLKIIDKTNVLLSGDYKNGSYLDGHIMDSIMNGRHAPGIQKAKFSKNAKDKMSEKDSGHRKCYIFY